MLKENQKQKQNKKINPCRFLQVGNKTSKLYAAA